MRMDAHIEIDAGHKTFAGGLLPELIEAVRSSRRGDLIALTGDNPRLGADLELWCRLTNNALIETTTEESRIRWVIRCGEAPANAVDGRPLGSRLWLYTNFRLQFEVRLLLRPFVARGAAAGARSETIRRIAQEAVDLGIAEIFVTGGEPFLLSDIGEILAACAAAAPTTVLTNGMLFAGPRLETLRALPRSRLTLQISLDSPTPERHDRHRGVGTWTRAWKGIERARAEGFRVRLAATVFNDDEAEEFKRFLDAQKIDARDRVIRGVALRGQATQGVALARADLAPEITITAEGVYWHPVGAEDADLLVTSEILPLAQSLSAVRLAFDQEDQHRRALAKIFNCA